VNRLLIEGLYKSFGRTEVLAGIELSVEPGEMVSILGPSGCGKTTLLNIVAGVLQADRGRVAGRPEGPVSYVFQEPRLLPWKTACGNVEFVLGESGGKPERDRRRELAASLLDLVGLADFHDVYPRELSGGMRQRVAIARAFAFPSDLLLMDEPFRALDLPLKLELIGAFLRLWDADRRTVLFVTHDIQEALLIGDATHVLCARPARNSGCVKNEVPQLDRRFQDPRLMELEQRLYQMILEAARPR
jgi:NitT/TauT family transport system ATP-binding protein